MIESLHESGRMLLELSITRQLQPSEDMAMKQYCDMFRVACRYVELQYKQALKEYGVDLFLPSARNEDEDLDLDADFAPDVGDLG